MPPRKRAAATAPGELSAYETKRQRNISENAAVMQELGLQPLVSTSRKANREKPTADVPDGAIARPGARLSSTSLWEAPAPIVRQTATGSRLDMHMYIVMSECVTLIMFM